MVVSRPCWFFVFWLWLDLFPWDLFPVHVILPLGVIGFPLGVVGFHEERDTGSLSRPWVDFIWCVVGADTGGTGG